MKKLCKYIFMLFNFALCIEHCAYSQNPGEWVWIRGDSIPLNPGNFGVQGIPDPLNDPPSTYESCNWTDQNGNFWLFGGWSPNGIYADMWKYDPLTNEWTWVKGPGTTNYSGSYGVQGVQSTTNNPPSMGEGVSTWTDQQGYLWLFGARKNDMWKYDISANAWTWMKGPNMLSDPGSYGIQGVPDPANNPAARYECASTWTDASGNLWLFGGIGNRGGFGGFNDLWKYDPGLNEWTWVSGSSSVNQIGVYGTKGVEAPANVPGARACYTHWMDTSGNLYLFGGEKVTQPYIQFNDFWRFNPVTGMWAWMSGTQNIDAGYYGTKCISDPQNVPQSKFENRSVWTDQRNNFWLFGGGMNTSASDEMNDLWVYCVSENKWIWQSGDSILNATGYFGTQGISSPLNKPGGRVGSVSWTGTNDRLFLFGGSISSWSYYMNDMWVYRIDTVCASCSNLPVASFYADDICPGTCANFQNLSSNGSTYAWLFPGAVPNSSFDFSPVNICYANPGTYDVTLIVTNANGSDTLSIPNYLTVYPQPASQSISQNGDTLTALAGAVSYQWFYNGNLINGATGYLYVASASGNYNVVATDVNGCEVEAAIFDVVATIRSVSDDDQLQLFPSPVSEKLYLTGNLFNGTSANRKISVYNIFGEQVPVLVNEDHTIVHCENLLPGLYLLDFAADKKTFHARFVKQ